MLKCNAWQKQFKEFTGILEDSNLIKFSASGSRNMYDNFS